MTRDHGRGVTAESHLDHGRLLEDQAQRIEPGRVSIDPSGCTTEVPAYAQRE